MFETEKKCRKILIVGLEPEKGNKVIDEFAKFGEIKRVDFKKNNNFMIIKYFKDYEAKKAIKTYDPFVFDPTLKQKIIKVDFFFEKIKELNLVDNDSIIYSTNNKRVGKPITIKIPIKHYLEKIYDFFRL